MRFEDNTPIVAIEVKGPLGEKRIEATIDTGAFKSLIPLEACHDLGLHLKEEREVRGVCEKPVKVKIFWTEIMLKGKRIDTVIGFDLPVNEGAKEFEKALIGRDILGDFKLMLDFKGRRIEFEDCR
jgi:Retroviral aspartyl protease.